VPYYAQSLAAAPNYMLDIPARRLFVVLVECVRETKNQDDFYQPKMGWKIAALRTLTDLHLTERHPAGWRVSGIGLVFLAMLPQGKRFVER
jgi:hypothetical protein